MIYDIAGLRIEINNVYPFAAEFCRAYLSENQVDKADMEITVSPQEIEEEMASYPQFTVGYCENICIYRQICLKMLDFNRMFLHAAVLEYDGAGYAFLGKSGAGKSTHTKLWIERVKGAKMVNGDKPMLEYTESEIVAHGTPWMGKEGRGDKTKVPLKALCFIEKSKTNEIVRLQNADAVKMLLYQLLMPTDFDGARKTLELADLIVKTLPIYLLKCDISKDAVRTSYTALTGKKFASDKEEE